MKDESKPAYTLKIRGGADTYIKQDGSIGTAGKGPLVQTDLSATLGVTQDQYLFAPVEGEHSEDYIVRRLTPTECAKLQLFPPDWCNDVAHSDSQEYKLWGNGISLPTLLPMMSAMEKILNGEE